MAVAADWLEQLLARVPSDGVELELEGQQSR